MKNEDTILIRPDDLDPEPAVIETQVDEPYIEEKELEEKSSSKEVVLKDGALLGALTKGAIVLVFAALATILFYPQLLPFSEAVKETITEVKSTIQSAVSGSDNVEPTVETE